MNFKLFLKEVLNFKVFCPLILFVAGVMTFFRDDSAMSLCFFGIISCMSFSLLCISLTKKSFNARMKKIKIISSYIGIGVFVFVCFIVIPIMFWVITGQNEPLKVISVLNNDESFNIEYLPTVFLGLAGLLGFGMHILIFLVTIVSQFWKQKEEIPINLQSSSFVFAVSLGIYLVLDYSEVLDSSGRWIFVTYLFIVAVSSFLTILLTNMAIAILGIMLKVQEIFVRKRESKMAQL